MVCAYVMQYAGKPAGYFFTCSYTVHHTFLYAATGAGFHFAFTGRVDEPAIHKPGIGFPRFLPAKKCGGAYGAWVTIPVCIQCGKPYIAG